jgi:hypothetical protein
MPESTQHSRIANYIREIITACENDPIRLEVATVHFTSLITAMKLYAGAPRHFTAIFEEGENLAQQSLPVLPRAVPLPDNADTYKTPIIGALEELLGKR